MKQKVHAVTVVSDGIVVEFEMGVSCYFPASFLSNSLMTPGNQVFLTKDPSPPDQGRMSLEINAVGSPTVMDGNVFEDGLLDRLMH